MFILDTNVISAVMGSQPVPEVAAWIAAQSEERLFTTTVCQAEILAGVEIMPEGRRRRGLIAAAKAIFSSAFDGRILPFDEKSAELYAEIFAARKRAGMPTTTDLMIAAIARSHDASMVTRDIGGFEGCGLTLINPWEAGSG
jgi:predicted nucleic acid-binding protein